MRTWYVSKALKELILILNIHNNFAIILLNLINLSFKFPRLHPRSQLTSERCRSALVTSLSIVIKNLGRCIKFWSQIFFSKLVINEMKKNCVGMGVIFSIMLHLFDLARVKIKNFYNSCGCLWEGAIRTSRRCSALDWQFRRMLRQHSTVCVLPAETTRFSLLPGAGNTTQNSGRLSYFTHVTCLFMT